MGTSARSTGLGTGTIVSIVLGLLIVLGAGSAISSYVTAANYGNEQEQQIKASYKDMENILAQYTLKIAEIAQVPEMYRDDLQALYKEAIGGRYGAGGSKAVFQFLKEQNPQLDPVLYRAIQQAMEAGRNQFQNSQTKFIDIKRGYETSLGYVWQGFWMKLAGYPKINLADYKIISSEHAVESFKTGVDKPVKLR